MFIYMPMLYYLLGKVRRMQRPGTEVIIIQIQPLLVSRTQNINLHLLFSGYSYFREKKIAAKISLLHEDDKVPITANRNNTRKREATQSNCEVLRF